jgi:hypothetical protein
MPREWTVKDYWDWNPAFTTGLANYQREQDRATDISEAAKNRELSREELGLRREDLGLRRATEGRLTSIQERREARLSAADLNDMTQKMAAALAYQGTEEDPEFLKNPAARSGWEIGKAERMKEQQSQQARFDMLAEQLATRQEIEEFKANLRSSQPSRFDFQEEWIRDKQGDIIGKRFNPTGPLGSQMIQGVPEAAGTPNTTTNILGRIDPKTGKLMRVN